MGLFSRLSPRRRRVRRQPATVDFGWATSSGRRSDNQDRAAATGEWAVVSDGVGGQPGGARAADLTVTAAVDWLERCPPPLGEEALLEAVRRAGAAVRAGRSRPGLARMDATLTAAVAVEVDEASSRWLVGWVGDSPAWVVTHSRARLVTSAHTLAAVLAGADPGGRGDAAVDFGRNVLMRTVATEDDAGADVVPVAVRAGEGLVVASDGLAEGVTAADIHKVWVSSRGAQATAERLVRAALRGGASDNVTVAVLRHSGA